MRWFIVQKDVEEEEEENLLNLINSHIKKKFRYYIIIIRYTI